MPELTACNAEKFPEVKIKNLTITKSNNNHNSYVRFKSGSQVPVKTFGVTTVYNPYNGHSLVQATLTFPFGGNSKKIVHREAHFDNVAREISVCDAILGKWEIDYSIIPELATCNGLKPKTVAQVPLESELDLLRQQMDEYKLLIQQQQQTIESFQTRIIEMENGTPVRVGG